MPCVHGFTGLGVRNLWVYGFSGLGFFSGLGLRVLGFRGLIVYGVLRF